MLLRGVLTVPNELTVLPGLLMNPGGFGGLLRWARLRFDVGWLAIDSVRHSRSERLLWLDDLTGTARASCVDPLRFSSNPSLAESAAVKVLLRGVLAEPNELAVLPGRLMNPGGFGGLLRWARLRLGVGWLAIDSVRHSRSERLLGLDNLTGTACASCVEPVRLSSNSSLAESAAVNPVVFVSCCSPGPGRSTTGLPT